MEVENEKERNIISNDSYTRKLRKELKNTFEHLRYIKEQPKTFTKLKQTSINNIQNSQ